MGPDRPQVPMLKNRVSPESMGSVSKFSMPTHIQAFSKQHIETS